MLKKTLRYLPEQVRFLLPYYLYGMLFFTLFRLLLFITELDQLQQITQANGRFLFSFWAFQTGFRFDTVISCYLLALPALVLTVANVAGTGRKQTLYRSSHYYLLLLYGIAFFICAADIPFFNYNFSRLNAVVFNWFGDMHFVTGMIVQEPAYFMYFFIFIFFLLLFGWLLRRRFRAFMQKEPAPTAGLLKRSITALVFLFLVFLGIRGRTQAPIRIENAFHTNYAFTNQLGLNPVFTLLVSYLDKVELMNPQQAEKNVRSFLQTTGNGSPSPLLRQVNSGREPIRKNIVLVLMESMSAEKMTRYGNPDHLTPNLDSIANISWCFNRIYSAGKHTFNGIYSTLYAYPAILRQHPMSALKINDYTGLPYVLKQNDYNTIYFTTHLETFDNAGTFLRHNGFDKIVSQHNYPKSKLNNIFGVPDHYMFQFAVGKINQVHQMGKPFLATLLTASDHGPYRIPDSIPFTPKPCDIRQQIVLYADWSIGRFMRMASKQPWYANTVFVFVADHGAVVGTNVYDMPLSYNHIPFLIFSPDTALIQPQEFNCAGGQIDVFPTLMGLLGFSYTNNTFGIDLLHDKRPFMFFSADDKIGCIDEEHFYTWRQQGEETLYNYRKNDPQNHLPQYKAKADSMRTYALSMVQCARWMIDQGLTGPLAGKGKHTNP